MPGRVLRPFPGRTTTRALDPRGGENDGGRGAAGMTGAGWGEGCSSGQAFRMGTTTATTIPAMTVPQMPALTNRTMRI